MTDYSLRVISHVWYKILYLKKIMAPFYGWGSIASRLEPIRGGSLLFTTKFPEIPGTHLINLGRIKDCVDLGATQWFSTREPWIGNPAPQFQKLVKIRNSPLTRSTFHIYSLENLEDDGL